MCSFYYKLLLHVKKVIKRKHQIKISLIYKGMFMTCSHNLTKFKLIPCLATSLWILDFLSALILGIVYLIFSSIVLENKNFQ